MKGSGLAEYLISILELFEAEGRVLKKQTIKTGYALGFIFVGMILSVISFSYLLWALHGVLAGFYGQSMASLMTAGLGILMSMSFLLAGRWLSK